MSENYLFLITILEIVAVILATAFYKKYATSKERYFLYFLWFTLTVELVGGILRHGYHIENFWVYNFYTIISFLFYFYWYHSILEKKPFKYAIVIFSTVFMIVALGNIMLESAAMYHTYTFVVGALFTLVCAIFHFWQLLNSDEILEVKHKLAFWISTGLLLFNMGMVPLMLLQGYFKLSGTNYVILIISLNVILYGCYIIGFLWTKEKYNRF